MTRSTKNLGLLSGIVVVATLLPGDRSARAKDLPQYRVVAPDVVRSGASFVGTVLEKKEDGGYAPIGPDRRLVFKGQVLAQKPPAKPDEPRTFEFPPFPTGVLGNVMSALVIETVAAGGAALPEDAGGGRSDTGPAAPEGAAGQPASAAAPVTLDHHFEVVNASQDASTAIKRVSEIATPGGVVQIEGQNLARLAERSLANVDDQRQFPLERVGSSYFQEKVLVPSDLPPGTYDLVARTVDGEVLRVPRAMRCPRIIDMKGTRVTFRGQRGKIEFEFDAAYPWVLTVAPPIITLDEDTGHDRKKKVEFTATTPGDYRATVTAVNREDLPPPEDAPSVDARVESTSVSHDSRSNTSTVTTTARVTGSDGRPQRNVECDVLTSHPTGVEYTRAETNRQGIARVVQRVPGRVEPTDVSTHVTRVVGRTWSKPRTTTTTTQQAPSCKVNKVGKKQKYSRGNNEAAQLKDQFAKTKGASYVPETIQIELDYALEPACTCPKGATKCTGDIDVRMGVRFRVMTREEGFEDPADYALLDGVAATGTTELKGSAAPGPDVQTTSDEVNYPPARPENNITLVKPDNYTANARAKVPCTAGSYGRRFHLTKKGSAGLKKQTPGLKGLASYVDLMISVAEPGVCELKLALKAYYLEYARGYPWLKAAEAELPQVDYQIGPAGPKGTTRNIAKLVEEDGKTVDTPFAPRAP